MEPLFKLPSDMAKKTSSKELLSSRRKTFSFAPEPETKVQPRKARASLAPSRSILKPSNEDNNTVIGVMQVSVNDDKSTSKKFAGRRVSFAPEATLQYAIYNFVFVLFCFEN